MRASLRFAILKRDRYTCAYCGGTPPNVLLHVDHIVPRCAGGTDAAENLVTSCERCNLGKGSTLLEEGERVLSAPSKSDVKAMRARVRAAKEAAKQSEAYAALVAEEANVRDRLRDKIIAHWSDVMGGKRTDAGWECEVYFPDDRSIRYFLRKLPLDRIMEAVDVTACRDWYRGISASKYFYGVCHRMIREDEEGESK